MVWKNWQYWKRGGFIGAIISLLTLFPIYIYITLINSCKSYVEKIPDVDLVCNLEGVFHLIVFGGILTGGVLILLLIVALLFAILFIGGGGFGIGALIGWMIGKIKSKNTNL